MHVCVRGGGEGEGEWVTRQDHCLPRHTWVTGRTTRPWRHGLLVVATFTNLARTVRARSKERSLSLPGRSARCARKLRVDLVPNETATN